MSHLKSKIQALFNPEQYHGWGKSKRYFEGWYYKLITADEKHAFAFIPGIAMDENGNKQAFIQVLDGKKKEAQYIKFSAEEFIPKPGEFNVKISSNNFQFDGFVLDLDDIKGQIKFKNQIPWPKPFYSPGIMGPFSFIPFMQCYHGILSMDQTIEGELNIAGEKIDFTGGHAYIEKDWGKSFPSAYIWMQSNHFSTPGISFKSSVAKIPWLGSSFVGFIAGLWTGKELIQFTTYNFTQLKKSFVDSEKVEIVLQNYKHRLEIVAKRDESTALASPILGFMDGRVEESMSSKIKLRLTHRKSKNVIFEDTGRNAGLEVAGKINEILV